MLPPTAIEPNAMYARSDLVAMYGARMADRICKTSRKVGRGRYMGFHVLEAINTLTDEYELRFQSERSKAAGKTKGLQNGFQEGRAPW